MISLCLYNAGDSENSYREVEFLDSVYSDDYSQFLIHGPKPSLSNEILLVQLTVPSNYSDTLVNSQCFIKNQDCQFQTVWVPHQITGGKGKFFVVSGFDQIIPSNKIHIVESIKSAKVHNSFVLNLPKSILATYLGSSINEFSDFRTHSIVSQISRYSKVYGSKINLTRTKIVVFGEDCKEVVDTINNFYKRVTEDNARSNLYVSSSEKAKEIQNSKPINQSKQDLKENKQLSSVILTYDKKLYDLAKPKIEQAKKLHKIRFDIKNIKDNQIRVEFQHEVKELAEKIKDEIEIKRDYFEILLERSLPFVTSTQYPSILYFKSKCEFEDFNLFEVKDNITGVSIIGNSKNIAKFKAYLEIFFENQKRLEELKQGIVSLNNEIKSHISKYGQ